MSFNPDRKVYKVVLLGDGGVGKTSLRKRYLGEGFKHNYMATIGADFAVKRLSPTNSDIIQIWDLAGQIRFSVVREGYYIGTRGAILVFDISRPQTFYNIPNWISELLKNINRDSPVPMALVGNKADLRGNDINYVSIEQAQEYAKELADWSELTVPYFETSALTGENVDYMFGTMVNNIEYLSDPQFDPRYK